MQYARGQATAEAAYVRLPHDGHVKWMRDATRPGQTDVKPKRQTSPALGASSEANPALRDRLQLSERQFRRQSRSRVPDRIQGHRLPWRYVDFRQVKVHPTIRHRPVGHLPFPQDPIVLTSHNIDRKQSFGAAACRVSMQFDCGETLG